MSIISRTLFAGPLLAMLLIVPWPLPAQTDGPDIQHWITGGVDVYFVKSEALPIVDLSLVFDAGSARDGELPGLASMTSNLLSEGAAGMDAGDIARRFERQGARFSTSSGRDTASVSLRSLSEPETLGAAVDALADVIGRPDFPEAAVERERGRMQVSLNRTKRDPGSIASRTFWQTAYPGHPYAIPPDGTEESIAAISRDDVQAFHRRHYVDGNATLALVGAISREQAEQIARAVGEALPAGESAPDLPAAPMLEESTIVRIPFNSTQSHIIMGHAAYARGDDAHFPLYVGNHIVGGGGLVSRLAEEMREKRGLSYSISSSFNPMQVAGPFQISTQVRSDRTDEARQVLLDTLSDFRANGPTDQELEDAIRNITGSFPLNLDSNSSLVNYVANIGFHDLPLDYLDTFTDNIEAVTADDVRTQFTRRLHPDQMITVIVGPEEDAQTTTD